MFHMLGRFVFTSSLPRRSSSGLSKGSNGFGFCFCESGPLSIVFISHQSIHYSHLKPRRWLLARPIAAPIRVPFPGDVPHHSYGSVLAPIICSLGVRRFPSPSPHPSHRDTTIPVDPRLFGLSKTFSIGVPVRRPLDRTQNLAIPSSTILSRLGLGPVVSTLTMAAMRFDCHPVG